MTIVRCPRCRDEVTLPDKASPRALVRCPLCLEEYLLAEVLADAPPALIIIGGEVPAEMLAPPGKGWGEPQASAEYQLKEEDAPALQAGNGALHQPADLASSSIAVGPSTGLRPATRVARPRRAEKSVVAEAVKVVAGGVIGLSLGLLVLWWGFRRDPLELGPTFAAYVPWLVPSQFRGSGGTGANGSMPRPTPPSMNVPDGPSANGGRLPRRGAKSRKEVSSPDRAASEGELQTLPLLEEPGTKPAAPELSVPLELPPERPGGSKARPSARPDPTAEAGRAPAPQPQPDKESRPPGSESAQDSSAQPTASPMPDLRDLLDLSFPAHSEESPLAKLLPPSPLADTVAAVAAAQAALRDYEAQKRDDAAGRQKAFAAWYAALGQVAQTLGAVPVEDEDPPARQALLHPLLDSLEVSPGKRSAAAHLTIEHWPQTTHGQGLLAVGKVAQCFEQGPPYRLLLAVQVRDRSLTLPLVLGTRPTDFCQVDDELVVLGRVVEQPHERLAGYADEHPKALWVCLARRVAPAP